MGSDTPAVSVYSTLVCRSIPATPAASWICLVLPRLSYVRFVVTKFKSVKDVRRPLEQSQISETENEVFRVTFDGYELLHMSAEYTVYAVGFVPGFPYLGYLPEQLCGVGRLASRYSYPDHQLPDRSNSGVPTAFSVTATWRETADCV